MSLLHNYCIIIDVFVYMQDFNIVLNEKQLFFKKTLL